MISFGKRLKFFRKKHGMTQKELGITLGFPETSAVIRIAQYEVGDRHPRDELVEKLTDVLGVSSLALRVPEISCADALMHALFALEDSFVLSAKKDADGNVVLQANKEELQAAFRQWFVEAEMLRGGEISLEEYDRWRYNFSCVAAESESIGARRAMYAMLQPEAGRLDVWEWDKALELVGSRDPQTGKLLDWRSAVRLLAEERGWPVGGYDFTTIEGLAVLLMFEPALLAPNLIILDRYKGTIRMPAGAIVMGYEDGTPAAIIWEEPVAVE